MSAYILLAEKILKKIKVQQEHGRIQNFEEQLEFVITEIKEVTKYSNFKVKESVCLNNLTIKNKEGIAKKMDFTLVPNVQEELEFILWLSGIIQRIVVDDNQKIQKLNKIIKIPKPEHDVRAEAIHNYFNSPKP